MQKALLTRYAQIKPKKCQKHCLHKLLKLRYAIKQTISTYNFRQITRLLYIKNWHNQKQKKIKTHK